MTRLRARSWLDRLRRRIRDAVDPAPYILPL